MATEIEKAADLFQQTLDGDNWTGINVDGALKDVNAQVATNRINDKHLNIAELAAHLTSWNIVIAKRLEGENYKPSRDEDFPVFNSLSDDEWEGIKNNFIASFQMLVSTLIKHKDSNVDAPIFPGASSAYRNIHGQISHLHYHLGQIVLLKKLI